MTDRYPDHSLGVFLSCCQSATCLTEGSLDRDNSGPIVSESDQIVPTFCLSVQKEELLLSDTGALTY